MSQLTTRDYKGAGRRENSPAGLKEFLLGALAGGVLAGVGTALVMHHMHRGASAACAVPGPAAPSQPAAAARQTPVPASRALSATTAAPSKGPNTGRRAAAPQLARAGSAGAASSGKPAPAQPQYDFYQMLPNLKVIVPRPTAPGARSVGSNGRTEFAGYVLQVGAYNDPAQARRVVTYLDSLGILAHIDTVHDGTAALYRVRIGPIIEQSELNRFRGVLKRIGLPGVLIPGATH